MLFFSDNPYRRKRKIDSRVSCLDRFRAVRWLAQHTAGHQREHHIHRNHEAAEGQYRYGRIRSGEIVGGYGQANTGVTHAAANGQHLAFLISGPPINQPTTQEPMINSIMASIPFVPINLIAGVLYLPAMTAAMMKITMDSLPNHKPSLGACWGIRLCKARPTSAGTTMRINSIRISQANGDFPAPSP